MKIYIVKVGLSGPISHPELVDLLKNAGCDTIQTSDGLCVQTDLGVEKMRKLHEAFNQLHFDEINPHDSAQVQTLSPDVQKFITSCIS